jgi:hypothetical protein
MLKESFNYFLMSKLNEYLELAFAIHAAASIFVALTPTPHDNKFVEKAYKVIEFFALVVGKAKQR